MMNTEMVYSILYTLLQRHEAAAEHYRRAAELAVEADLQRYLSNLADYRTALGREVRAFLEDSSPVPVRNKSRKDITPMLVERWPEMEEALKGEDRVKVLHLCHATEKELFRHYQKGMADEDPIAGGILDLLQQQHRKVMEVTRKTERLETIPQKEIPEMHINS